MNNKLFYCLFAVLIVVAALLMRSHQLADRAPFDWDQNRDYGEVVKIAQGELVVLGPVARGIGGFFLGSLYYYLLYPAFFLMKGDLTALPLTSVVLDSIVPGLIFLLYAGVWGTRKAGIASLIWAFSWFAIEASHVSWNVALIPLWSVLTLYVASRLKESEPRMLYAAALLTGLAAHIHVTAIPLIPLLLLLRIRSLKFSPKTWAIAICVGLLPVLPLIAHDAMHSLQNLRLVKGLFSGAIRVQTPLIPMILMSLIKLGKAISGLIFARFADNLWMGITIVMLALSYLRARSSLIVTAAQTALISWVLVIAFRDYGFPEYYFSVAYIPIVVLAVELINSIASRAKRLEYPLLLGVVATIVYMNMRAHFVPLMPGYNLGVKQKIVDSLHAIGQPIEIRYAIQVPGREGGLGYLVDRSGLVIDPSSKYKVIITDNIKHGAYYEGEYATDQLIWGNLKTALYIDVR